MSLLAEVCAVKSDVQAETVTVSPFNTGQCVSLAG